MKAYPLLTVAMLATLPQAALGAGDPVRGKTVFMQCRVCHVVDMRAKSGFGPNLYGVIGRPVATVKGFAYSPAMAKKGGQWTPARFDAFVAGPAKFVPGTRMTYPGMANPADRQHLIAYLISLAK